MNCYYHPETGIVATCQDCNKGLCKNCSDKFSIPICATCNGNRGAAEKTKIITELGWMIGIGAVSILFLSGSGPAKHIIKQQPLLYVFYFYMFVAVVAGWNKLNKFTARYFLFLPLIGWVIYFIVKLYISAIVGFFIAPFRIYKNISRLTVINQIQKIK